jgi:hypothetical protein
VWRIVSSVTFLAMIHLSAVTGRLFCETCLLTIKSRGFDAFTDAALLPALIFDTKRYYDPGE